MTFVTQATRVAVWDPLVRYGHWILAAAFATAYLSAEEEGGGDPDLVHVWAGYVVGIVVALRVVWGFVGPRHARFADFVYGPGAVLRYLGDLLRGRGQRYLGHSPAGGAMAIALLIGLAATAATGIVAYGERGKGPLADTTAIARAYADEAEGGGPAGTAPQDERGESAIGELHATLANITLALVILHLLGVAAASVVHRENLVAAMITGHKRAGD
jgi:cytochrome b